MEGKNLTKKIQARYDRIAPVFSVMDHMIKDKWREQLLSKAYGKVLEVGVGTGANLPFYPAQVSSVTAIDFSSRMLKYARKNAQKSSVPVEFHQMDIEELAFEDESFDTVVSTCVFCSVPDPVKGLEEIHRVLKKDGQLLMLEHMRSESAVLGAAMDVLNPAVVRIIGANINRKTMDNLSAAQFHCRHEDRIMGAVMRELHLNK